MSLVRQGRCAAARGGAAFPSGQALWGRTDDGCAARGLRSRIGLRRRAQDHDALPEGERTGYGGGVSRRAILYQGS